ncbi:FtsX-like permease family protein [Ferruginibacter albus]|uniref:FtsX-like permease family protein n=1 Tax=Ferruginibacter albus TaxID=2875540 RepID=UPI001CC67C42|nr:FtsX-like permease family protein [Ferruginibacter albus]UAY51814.1 FtsX-like permease family protein [Ferruginibacter albus]
MNLLFAWRYFKAKKSANAINIIAWVTVGVIAFATACQILVLSVFNGFEDLVKSLYASFYTDIKIIPAKGKTFTLTHEQLSLLQKQSSVNAVSLIAEEKALLKNEDDQTIVYLKGVDENYTKVTDVASKIVEGDSSFNLGTANNPQLIVGSGIQSAVGINTDGALPASILTVILPKIKITNADPLQSLSEGNAKASAVFLIQQEFDNKYAITNIDFVKQQMGFSNDEYSAVEIKLASKADLQLAKQQLSSLLGNNYKVQTKYEQNTSLYNTMKLEKWFIYAVLTLILIIAAFNMISALTMLVLEKKKDISILQSLGADQKRILKIFLSEGLLLGTIGAATGIILATIVCILQLKYKLIKLQGGTFLIDYFPVKMQATDFVLVAATSMIIAFIASWLPAYKAAKQKFELRGN